MMRGLLLVVAVHCKREPPLGGRHGARLRTYAQLGRRRVPTPNSTPDHVKRVYEELDRSVAYFPQTTNRSDAGQIVAEILAHPYGLALLNGRLFAHEGVDLKTIRQFRLLLEASDRRRLHAPASATQGLQRGQSQRLARFATQVA